MLTVGGLDTLSLYENYPHRDAIRRGVFGGKMEELQTLNKEIDSIDEQIVQLLDQRMALTKEQMQLQTENRVFTPETGKERELIARVTNLADKETKFCAQSVFHAISTAERSQRNTVATGKSIVDDIHSALDSTEKLFPLEATVACQGTEGAYSQITCDRMFKTPSIMFFDSFSNVFKAVEAGLCQYGVLPIENSTAGSVNAVYDQMLKHNFYIVKSARIKVNHYLLANKGATLDGIKEIISHQQAISQCSAFLSSLKNVDVHAVTNTAVAAKTVAESGRLDIASISSVSCGEDYNLVPLKENIQDSNGNYTRFICISKKMEIYPGADRISLIINVPHKPGSLYNVLAKFYSLGVNIRKLESRPVPDTDFEFEFYFDVESPIYAPETDRLLRDLEAGPERVRYLGSYNEILI